MASTRLFHTLVLAGAALVSTSLTACAGEVGPEDPSSEQASQTAENNPDQSKPPQLGSPVDPPKGGDPPPTFDKPRDAGSDARPDDAGWAPTK